MARNSHKPPTMHDVAELANVSHQTVSRVINNSPNVADCTKERVLLAIKALNYHPNKTARTLITGRSNLIQVISFSKDFNQPVPPMISRARDYGYHITYVTLNDPHSRDELREMVDDLRSRLVDGVILITPFELFSALEYADFCRDMPFILVGPCDGEDVSSIYYDQKHGMTLLVEYLLNLGHRQIAEIYGPLDNADGRVRHETLHALLKANGLPPGPAREGRFIVHDGYRAAKEMLAAGEKFTALVCANDEMAAGAMRAIHEAGLRIPEDISVVGFDDINYAPYFEPPLTTVRQDYIALGDTSVDLLIMQISDRETPCRKHVLQPELVVRQSTGKARKW